MSRNTCCRCRTTHLYCRQLGMLYFGQRGCSQLTSHHSLLQLWAVPHTLQATVQGKAAPACSAPLL